MLGMRLLKSTGNVTSFINIPSRLDDADFFFPLADFHVFLFPPPNADLNTPKLICTASRVIKRPFFEWLFSKNSYFVDCQSFWSARQWEFDETTHDWCWSVDVENFSALGELVDMKGFVNLYYWASLGLVLNHWQSMVLRSISVQKGKLLIFFFISLSFKLAALQMTAGKWSLSEIARWTKLPIQVSPDPYIRVCQVNMCSD